MLEKIREGATGIAAKVILGLVILSFVFAGVGSYINSGVSTAVAEVNGEEILASTFEQAFQSQRSRMEAQLGELFEQFAANPEYLNNLRQSVLDELINEKLLEQKTQDLGIRVSDTELRKTILTMNEFMVAGQFNSERYNAILLQAGFSPEEFRTYMRNQLARQQFSSAVLQSDFALESEASQYLSMQNETRSARYLELDSNSFREEQSTTDEEINNYYQENISQFDTDEKVKLQYVEVKVEDFLAEAVADEEQVALYYEENQNSYRTEEERRASHILIEFGDDESASEAKAQGLLDRLNAGEDFEELAKAESQDTFSGENGGDLDWFTRGVMDPDFETAAFALENVGDLSQVVRSEFGFHIIKLTDVKPEQVQAFDDVKAEIVEVIKRESAVEEYLDVQQRMSEVAFEVPEGLEEVAAVADVEVKETVSFSRLSAPEPFNDGALLNQAFSEELIADGVNSDVIEVNDEHFVFLRIAEHEPERTKPLSEVESEVKDALLTRKAKDAALQWLKDIVTQLESGADISERLVTKALEWQEATDVDRNTTQLASQLKSELFKLGKLNAATAIELSGSKVGLIQLTAITTPEVIADTEIDTTQLRLAQSNGQTSYTVLMEAVNQAAEVNKTL